MKYQKCINKEAISECGELIEEPVKIKGTIVDNIISLLLNPPKHDN